MIPVKMVMRREVLTTNVNTPIRKVGERMQDQRIGCLLVVDGKEPLGILTESDIVQKVVAAGRDPATTMAGEVMSTPLITIGPDESVVSADELMDREHIRHLAVVDQGDVIGIVSVRDLLFPMQYLAVFSDPNVIKGLSKAAKGRAREPMARSERRVDDRVKLKRFGNKVAAKSPFGKVRAEHLMERDVPYYHADALGLTLATSMINRHCGAIPIVNGRRDLIGIVTEFDLLNALIQGRDLEKVQASEIMAGEPKFVRKDTPAEEIIKIMDSLHLIHIPVVDAGGKLLGLIERSDILLGYLESRQGTLQP